MSLKNEFLLTGDTIRFKNLWFKIGHAVSSGVTSSEIRFPNTYTQNFTYSVDPRNHHAIACAPT